MVHPLVEHHQRPFYRIQMRYGIFRQDRHSEGIDQFRDSVIDLGVNMVGASCENNSVASGFLQIFQSFLALLIHRFSCARQFVPARPGGSCHFSGGNIRKRILQTARYRIQIRKSNERIFEPDMFCAEAFHVVFNIFRIGSDDRAVVVVRCIFKFRTFIWNARIEDVLNPFPYQPFDMAVCQLCRITFRFARNGLNPEFINLSGTRRGENDPVFQFRKEFEPERIIFIHVENARDADDAAHCLVLRKRFIGEQQFILKFKQVRNLVFIPFLTDSALTAVSAYELTAAGETVDRQAALVRTAFAFRHRSRILQRIDAFQREHSRLCTFLITLPRDQRGTKGAHDTCNVRTDCFASRNFLKTSQDSVIVERTALNDDMVSELRSVGNFNYLIKCIFDNRVSQSG